MTTTAEAIERIKKALEAGANSAAFTHPRDDNKHAENSAFAEACSPEAIGAILASHAALLEALSSWVVLQDESEKQLADSTAEDFEDLFGRIDRKMVVVIANARAAIQSATQSTKESTK